MKIFKETRERLNRLLDRFVSNYQCRLGVHDWSTPSAMCGGEEYQRFGKRQCTHCKREETLMLYKNGNTEWICHKEKLKNLLSKWVNNDC